MHFIIKGFILTCRGLKPARKAFKFPWKLLSWFANTFDLLRWFTIWRSVGVCSLCPSGAVRPDRVALLSRYHAGTVVASHYYQGEVGCISAGNSGPESGVFTDWKIKKNQYTYLILFITRHFAMHFLVTSLKLWVRKHETKSWVWLGPKFAVLVTRQRSFHPTDCYKPCGGHGRTDHDGLSRVLHNYKYNSGSTWTIVAAQFSWCS